MSDDQPAIPAGKRTEQVTRTYDADGKLIKTTTTIVVINDSDSDSPWPGQYL